MGKKSDNRLPKGWLNCPPNGNSLIASKFMALKTPLSQKYDKKLNGAGTYHPEKLFFIAKRNKVKFGLWIDLTNTCRYYDKEDIENQNCRYEKINCDGHGQCPPKATVKQFISLVHNFIVKYPQDCIAVHCTHGFNRTGFLIVSFLVENFSYSVAEAVEAFARSRPPGVYRGNYIRELFRRYGNHNQRIPPTPSLPHWCDERNRRQHNRFK